MDGYEGPLDLLLDLARRQKVDLAQISVLALAEQYLAFIETVREKRIEIAADYLVMAAWLAYLKSRLMVPQAASRRRAVGRDDGGAPPVPAEAPRSHAPGRQPPDEPPAPRPRGLRPRHARADRHPSAATSGKRASTTCSRPTPPIASAPSPNDYTPFARTVWSLNEAREILKRLIGDSADWVPMQTYLAEYLMTPEDRATVMASTFASSLELVRQGHVELRQNLAFGPLFVRRRQGAPQQ